VLNIETKYLDDLKNWFDAYVTTFMNGDEQSRINVALKVEHTKRVCQEIRSLGKKLMLQNHELDLCDIIALFHDVGRFQQYARYKTFVDHRSENHAELGVKILKSEDVLSRLSETTKSLIFRIIRYHNRKSLPHDETESCLFFARLLRDADKLDIWKIVTDYYHRNDGKRNYAIELDLPDTPEISEAVYQEIMGNRIVTFDHVKTLNDFKLLQVSWLFDINFYPAFQAVQSRRYIEMIKDVLPKTENTLAIFNVIQHYVNRYLDGNGVNPQ